MTDREQHTDSRSGRILDAAGELLLRLGYRKVTMSDIAQQARIGKGTIYLHWRTKELLFEALIARESIELTEEILAELRADDALVLPHRLMSAMLLATERRPLVKALLTGDMELLGALADSPLGKQDALANVAFYAVLSRHGLLRTDVPHLVATMQAAMTGFYTLETLSPDAAELDTQAKADGLAHTVRCAFEPQGQPTPQTLAAAAAEVIAVFEDMTASLGQWVHPNEPQPRSG